MAWQSISSISWVGRRRLSSTVMRASSPARYRSWGRLAVSAPSTTAATSSGSAGQSRTESNVMQMGEGAQARAAGGAAARGESRVA